MLAPPLSQATVPRYPCEVTLNVWASSQKRMIFEELLKGRPPSVGDFDAALLKDALTLGKPQMGETVFTPTSARLEFVFAGTGSTIVFSVHLSSPERIVFLPVPDWVVESIWQGHIEGSFHFESQALQLVDNFRGLLTTAMNEALFAKKLPTRRE